MLSNTSVFFNKQQRVFSLKANIKVHVRKMDNICVKFISKKMIEMGVIIVSIRRIRFSSS